MSDRGRGPARGYGVLGALLAAFAVALAAYGSHAAAPEAARRLLIAAAFAFGHGLALVMLPALLRGLAGRLALASLAAGTLLFSGALTAAALAGTGTAAAPAGGGLLIGGWLLVALARLRG